ncbi:taurine ABC transporter substrate-binding protein [Nocardia seriolae]|uniref:Glycine/betaine ABC transporter substrate-binding protein n=3 Tax=Nocardia seriolae TaxID=37332 RepID=A0ABC9YVE0_9NOCA|nr:glycine betaine ABC transporter substrate-binding protein [Nocardia seriolae]APA98913.1 Taurine-binding periplasmic protein [Nocardia seriolae]QOW35606.1 ABC transporter substrate-binding protein [Nocardia seriolae]QUN16906.1 ABC transporter substrate-binding protein [Nocardia seriolae]WKY49282.1 ABC transporter substrate-binding protein [Nocardia seriolae]WNJ55985.1 ABC transporter substrate-binding protein [Nocardia seriolae]
MKRAFAAAALAGLLTASLTACVRSGRTDQSRAGGDKPSCPVAVDESFTGTVRLGYQDIPNGDLVVKDAGLLETCLPEATITWSKFASGATVIQAFGSNSLDLGLLGSAAAARALSAPLNIGMTAVWVHDVIGTAESLAVKDPAITTVAGLRGKKIAVPFASTSHYSLLAALTAAGIERDVNLINMQPDAIAAAWRGGDIDAAFIWEPTLSELLKNGHVVTTAAETAKAGKPTYDLEGARADFVSSNPRFLAVWTAAQNWAVNLIKTDPDTAATRISAQLGVPVADIRKQLGEYAYLNAATQAGPGYLGRQLGAALKSSADFLLSQGEIQGLATPEIYAGAVYAEAAGTVAAK